MRINALTTKQKLKRPFLATAMIFALAGCGNGATIEMQDLEDFVKNAGLDMRGKVEPPPDIHLLPVVPFKASPSVPQPFDPARLQTARR
jgi:Tfp pilus assembly protein PilP